MRDDAGYATVLAAGILLVLVAVLGTVVVGVSYIRNAHLAQRAADFSAIAGAQELYFGREACVTATAIATRNGGTVIECIVRGDDLTVAVRVGRRVAVSTAGPTIFI